MSLSSIGAEIAFFHANVAIWSCWVTENVVKLWMWWSMPAGRSLFFLVHLENTNWRLFVAISVWQRDLIVWEKKWKLWHWRRTTETASWLFFCKSGLRDLQGTPEKGLNWAVMGLAFWILFLKLEWVFLSSLLRTAIMAESFVSWFALGDLFVVAGCCVVQLSQEPPLESTSALSLSSSRL